MSKWFIALCLLLPCINLLYADQLAVQRTLSLIKPDAVKADHIGEIIARFEKSGLKVIALKMTQLDRIKAGEFYAAHREKPFFQDLVAFMTSGPIVAIVLEGPNAVAKNRELMGATDFRKALPGTIRKDFASSMTQNAVHGSDSPEAAEKEVAFFFTSGEIFTPTH